MSGVPRELNVYSRGFDAAAALAKHGAGVPLPNPNARQFDNIMQQPIRLLHEDPFTDIQAVLAVEKPKEDARRAAIQEAIKDAHKYRREVKEEEEEYMRTGGVLKDIADQAAGKGRGARQGDWIDPDAWKDGPLGNMARWRDEGRKVAVTIRSNGKMNAAVRG